jgi:uncharacterized protein involved in response to NO
MLFGYTAIVIAGFLFTAVPNWTGRMPARGWPLVALLALWVCGRLAVAGLLPAGPLGALAIDCTFLLAIALMIVVEIVAGRNWRNLKVVVPVLLLFAANVVFHVEAMTQGSAGVGRRLGISVVVFLIMLVGGRVVPSFTRNWLAKRGATAMPVPFGRFDALCLVIGAAAMLLWTGVPEARSAGLLLVLAGGLHLGRLGRWRGWDTWRSPLLLMLHAAYAFVPIGLAATGAAAVGNASPAAGMHLLGIGAIGGMTVAVMMRATRGHTGRDLVAGGWLSTAFMLILTAAVARALAPSVSVGDYHGVVLAAGLWTIGFAIFAFRVGPWLALPNPAPRQPNRSASRPAIASRAH